MITTTKDRFEQDVQTFLSKVESGETVIIESGGAPVAELRPPASRPRAPRPFGLCAGEFEVPEDFDAPLPEEILRAFEGE